MTKILIAALVAAPLTLAACVPADGASPRTSASSTSTAPVEYVTDDEVIQSPPVTQEEVADEEDIFLTELDRQGVRYTSETEALLGGLTVCSFIDEGNSSRELFWEMSVGQPTERILDPVSNADLPAFMGISVGVLCPEFRAQVERDLAGGR